MRLNRNLSDADNVYIYVDCQSCRLVRAFFGEKIWVDYSRISLDNAAIMRPVVINYLRIELLCNRIQIGRVLGRRLDEDVGKVTDAIEVLFVRVIRLNTAPSISYYCNEERIK